MSTTKKVASKPVPKKPKKLAISSAKKTKSVPKKMIKATLSKSPVKKVFIHNKTQTQKQGVKRKAKKVVHEVKSKLDTIESLHSSSKRKAKEAVGAVGDHIDVLRPKLALALLSPYRFPIDTQRVAVSTARLGGVFFMLVGAVFTLFYASQTFGTQPQLASVVATSAEVGEQSTYVNCNDPLQYESTACAKVVNHKPDAVFNIDGIREQLHGSTNVKLTVPHAKRVKLGAYYKTGNQELVIDLMENTANDTWELPWNTALYADGEYRLKVLIENIYGAYEDIDSTTIFIENNPFESTPVLPFSDTSTTSPDTLFEAEVFDVTLRADVPESSSEFRFTINADTADFVKMYAYHVSSGRNIFLGNAYIVDDTTWKYRWNAKDFTDGEYIVRAQVLYSGVSTASEPALVNKVGIQQQDTAISSTTLNAKRQPILQPEIIIDTQSSIPFADIVPVNIEVDDALAVELYVVGRFTLVQKYLGNAVQTDSHTWIYRFNTRQIPNGEYELLAQVTNQYGTYTKKTELVKIFNVLDTPYSSSQEAQINALVKIAEEHTTSTTTLEVSATSTVEATASSSQESALETSTTSTISAFDIEEVLSIHASSIQLVLQEYAVALRLKDTDAIAKAREGILLLKANVLQTGNASTKTQSFIDAIDAYIQQATLDIEENVEAIDTLIFERTQEKASLDTDSDGITNYDEVSLYKTNPFSADTDGDGFVDGAEVQGGYNPTDGVSEVLVEYQSPLNSGITREDVLTISSIITALPNEDTEAQLVQEQIPQAIITGMALPNSYVTLYIFSTPTIVTVKTEEDGSWSYRLHKELEDGEHQMYIGITDNAGNIVAKSSPFSFIKRAEAFSPIEDGSISVPVQVLPEADSRIPQYMTYLVLSISVVAIGLLLLLLGFHVQHRHMRSLLKTTPETVEKAL